MFIIFTIGRTGSSLLVNILNKFKDVTFSGEIYNIQLLMKMNRGEELNMEDFSQIFKKIERTDKSTHTDIKKIGGKSCSPLYFPKDTNLYKYHNHPGKFIKNLKEKNTILEKLKYIMPLNKVIGCKILASYKVVDDFLNCNISKHFKIILLIREDIDKLQDSMKRASFKNINLEMENREYKRIDMGDEGIYLLSYEDILKRNENFRGLFKFINVGYSNKLVSDGFKEICSYASSLNKIKN